MINEGNWERQYVMLTTFLRGRLTVLFRQLFIAPVRYGPSYKPRRKEFLFIPQISLVHKLDALNNFEVTTTTLIR